MADFTSRAKLEKPENGEFADQEVLNRNFDSLDKMIGAQHVTSTTRPPTPFVGLQIWESDTERLYLWNGTRWVYLAGPAMSSPVDGVLNLNTAGDWTAIPGKTPLVISEMGTYLVTARATVSYTLAAYFVTRLGINFWSERGPHGDSKNSQLNASNATTIGTVTLEITRVLSLFPSSLTVRAKTDVVGGSQSLQSVSITAVRLA